MSAPTRRTAPHDAVLVDLDHCGYHALAPHIHEHRTATGRYNPDDLAWTRPVDDATRHLCAALVLLRRAADERTPGARLTYHALLAVAGGLARRLPTIPEPRRPA